MNLAKNIIVWGLLTLLVLLVAGLGFAKLNEDKVKSMVLEQLNEQLNTEINAGEISLTLFEQFPFISLRLPNVVAKSTNDDEVPLLKVEDLFFNFNLLEAIQGNFNLTEVSIRNGELNLAIDGNGNPNYLVLKKVSDSTKTSFAVNLENLVLENIKLTYKDHQLKQDFLFDIEQANLKGRFTNNDYDIDLKSNAIIEHLKIDQVNYISEQQTTIQTKFHVNEKDKTYQFREGGVKIQSVQFDITGIVKSVYKGHFIDISIISQEANVQTLNGLLPQKFISYLEGITSKGRLSFETNIKGNLSRQKDPSVNITFAMKDGTISIEDHRLNFVNVNFMGEFENGNNQSLSTSTLKLEQINTKVGDKSITGNLTIRNFDNPQIESVPNGSINMESLLEYFEDPAILNANGRINFNFKTRGLLKDFKSKTSLGNIKIDGELNADAVGFEMQNSSLVFNNINGQFIFNGNDVAVLGLEGNISNSDFSLDGNFRNVLPFLFSADASLILDAKVRAKKIDLNELLLNDKVSSDTLYTITITPKLNCNIYVECDQMKFRNFKARNISGNFIVERQQLTTENLEFSSMGGEYFLKGNIDATDPENIIMTTNAFCKEVDINQLFYQCENFGQGVMTDKHLKGKVTSDISLYTAWTSDLSSKLDRVMASCDIIIDGGELINFEPMMALSKYLDISDLKNIKFSTVKNTIEIKDQKIYIPEMKVKTNAIDLKISGYHTFDNHVNYNIQIKLSEILSKKAKNRFKDIGEIEKDEEGKATLYLVMTGDAEDPDFRYDKKSVKDKLKNDFKKERKELGKVFKDEINKLLNKPTEEDKNIKPIEIEWDEPIDNNSTPDTVKDKGDEPFKNFKEKLKEFDDE
ncbi:MAG: hypothetical protein JKY33_08105 [Bacteroidia bacterium]|nr:hypothetical protein [Bacteroidia bacterium]